MKVIQQIIRHLRARGVLSERQYADLRDRGFMPPEINSEETSEDEGTRHDLIPVPDPVLRHEALIDAAEASHGISLDNEGKGGRRGKTIVHKGPLIGDRELVRNLRELFSRWKTPLSGLTTLGMRLGAKADWRDASRVIRGADDAALSAALAAGLSARKPALNALFDALALDDYCTVADPWRGPAVTAYKALLSSTGAQPAGRYRWLLMHDEVAAVGNLRSAQRRTLRALGALLASHPALIARCVRRDRHMLAYWTLTLVYSARRGTANKRPPPVAGEVHPSCPFPDDREWQHALSLALLMDPRAVGPFFVEYHELLNKRVHIARDTTMNILEKMEFNPYDGLMEMRLKNLSDVEQQDIMGKLASGVSNELIARGAAYFLPGHRISAADLVECCLSHEQSKWQKWLWPMIEIFDRYPGRIASLLCPRAWDGKSGKCID